MSSVNEVIEAGRMLPAEGKCIAINLTAGVAANLDCSQFATNGEMVTIFNASGGALGFKFSPSATPNISVTSVGGADACGRMQTMTSERGFIPIGMPNLHLVSPNPGYVYVYCSSTLRG